ncbi:SpaH/EbpB family LPXTG-anchored major pilin [Microbacterium paludicola]|uniref:SpaH/EbpB family LPXTG-anchored major pilin n=1 Tax=Microbacterium paludicola TaxID=300019 RepID=UPI0016425243|nr:SpaH/EbpB family LPXTG-anchored major pilin [Microbacterium paludicola]
MNERRPIRRLASGVGVLALALAGVIGGASMASATTVGPGQPGAPDEGTLVVHKYAGSATEQSDNGTEQTVDRPPLGGVTFEVTPVGKDSGSGCVALDLGTAAGWADAQVAVGSMPPASPYCLATADSVTQVTDATGTASFSGLPLGLYHVDETAAPAGVVPSVEFYVTLPYASEQGKSTDWLYTVHTYPKNTLEGDGDKTVADPSAHGLGSTVPWTIQSKPIGSFNDGQRLTSFSLYDILDAKLTYTATPAATLTYTEPGGSPVAVPSFSLTEPTGAGGTLTASVTDMDWLNERPAGTFFTFSFSTVVTGVGDIKNEGFQNSGGDPVTLGEASTQWGPAEILKHQKGDKKKTLAGAKFSVFDSPNGTDCTGPLGAALTVNGQTEFESGANGVVAIAGLWVGNDNTAASRVYCVVETQEPVGYVKDTTPRMITVKPEATATTTAHIDVANTPVPGPSLPMTGANGTLWFTVGGIALIAMAGGGLLLVRRARSHE